MDMRKIMEENHSVLNSMYFKYVSNETKSAGAISLMTVERMDTIPSEIISENRPRINYRTVRDD